MKSGKLSQEHREQRTFGVQIWKQNLKQLSLNGSYPPVFWRRMGVPYPLLSLEQKPAVPEELFPGLSVPPPPPTHLPKTVG